MKVSIQFYFVYFLHSYFRFCTCHQLLYVVMKDEMKKIQKQCEGSFGQDIFILCGIMEINSINLMTLSLRR